MKSFPWLELFIILALVAIIGAFLFTGQYRLIMIIIVVFGAALTASFCINYADERARESVHMQNMLASLIQQQQDFYTKKIDYLLDRIQTGDPIVAHNLNVSTMPRKLQSQTINLPTVDGVPVKEVETNAL